MQDAGWDISSGSEMQSCSGRLTDDAAISLTDASTWFTVHLGTGRADLRCFDVEPCVPGAQLGASATSVERNESPKATDLAT
jgi:hypothetical protein